MPSNMETKGKEKMCYKSTNNSANADVIASHWIACNFTPELSSCTNISEYITKIIAYAERYELWEGNELIAFGAVYQNQYPKAFLTIISVVSSRKGLGIGKLLLKKILQCLVEKRYESIDLEVFSNNTVAMKLYISLGFELVEEINHRIIMRKILKS